jgi:D-tyrosyl-tRNA(Tyr) deacylase
MRAVVQRVSRASVSIEGGPPRTIGEGLVVLLGVRNGDGAEDVRWTAEKCANLRVFLDEAGKMNRSCLDVGGAFLVISQFTLYGDCSRGRRPSFTDAAPPEEAESLYESFVEALERYGRPVATGAFGAMMKVELANEGPVTILIDSKDRRGVRAGG